jgi:hypothetical protein
VSLLKDSSWFRRFGIAAIILVVATVLLYPHFCNAVDPDDTAYLTLARRWATGDWARAVNGYWSPWGIWLTALLAKTGLAVIPAAIIQNTSGALLLLLASLLLFRRLNLSARIQIIFTVGLLVFLQHAIYAQWFDDLWAAAFLLLALYLLLHKDFSTSPRLWVAYGCIGALAYYAKAYSLPFFALSTLVCSLPLLGADRKRWMPFLLISGSTAALLCVPWWIALHSKYGFWTTGTAGALNLSWGLLGHPIFTEGPQSLLAPRYPDSPSFWEDPWWVNAKTVHFWDSWRMVGMQLIRIAYFSVRLCIKACTLSPLVLVGLIAALRTLIHRRRHIEADERILCWQMVLFPIGLLFVHSESRYLWYLVPITMCLVGRALQQQAIRRQTVLALVAALCFCIEPALSFPKLWHLGRQERRLAFALKKVPFEGAFALSSNIPGSYPFASRLAFFSGVPYWAEAGECHEPQSVLQQMRRRSIPFRIHLLNGAQPLPGEKLVYSTRNASVFYCIDCMGEKH